MQAAVELRPFSSILPIERRNFGCTAGRLWRLLDEEAHCFLHGLVSAGTTLNKIGVSDVDAAVRRATHWQIGVQGGARRIEPGPDHDLVDKAELPVNYGLVCAFDGVHGETLLVEQ